MGMAASQARFLGLTARKNNVEFEGQQINQQRTSLSNESASYYNQLLALSVPTPPNSADFTKIQYGFTDPASLSTATVVNMVKDPNHDGKYIIKYNVDDTDWKVSDPTATTVRTLSGISLTTSWVAVADPSSVTGFSWAENPTAPTTASFAAVSSSGKDLKLIETDPNQPGYDPILNAAATAINEKLGTSQAIYVMNKGTDLAPDYIYFTQEDLDNSVAGLTAPKPATPPSSLTDTTGDTTGNVNENVKYYVYSEVTEEVTKTLENVEISRDNSGRITSLYTSEVGELPVITKTITDTAAYDDAMNEYEYQQYKYEQEMNNINSRIQIVQEQDKNLELRLKQLDTEEKAIQTEIDSVQSVIKNNVENSFKTFSA